MLPTYDYEKGSNMLSSASFILLLIKVSGSREPYFPSPFGDLPFLENSSMPKQSQERLRKN